MTYAEYKVRLMHEATKTSNESALTRKIYQAVVNFGGMGRSKLLNESELWTIPLIDFKAGEMPIRSLKEALQLVKDMITPN